MNLKKILSTNLVTTDLKGNSKNEIIESMLDLLMNTGKVSNREAALESVMNREAKMSTGMKHGIAIPHGKTDVVDELVACVGISKEPIDFEALDGEPSRIFIMTLSPVNKTGPHIQFLAEVSQLLREEEKRNELLNASTDDQLLKALTDNESN